MYCHTKPTLNSMIGNGKCLTKMQLMFVIFTFYSDGGRTFSTDLEEINTEDELAQIQVIGQTKSVRNYNI